MLLQLVSIEGDLLYSFRPGDLPLSAKSVVDMMPFLVLYTQRLDHDDGGKTIMCIVETFNRIS
jgi:hypothetical protein